MSVIHILRAELELTGPGAVAAPEAHTVPSVLRPDLPLARDGWGNPYLPATSLTGSLRHHTPQHRRQALFGDVVRTTGTSRGNGRDETTAIASTVRVLGTRLTLPDAPLSERRRTAVDRHRAAAKATTLHNRELLPPGTELALWLRTDTTASPLIDEVVELLAGWRPRIGGGRTTGHGRAELITVRHRAIDLSTPEGLHHWLTTGGPALVDDHATVVHERAHHQGGAPDEPHLFGTALPFRIADALHIGTGASADRPGRNSGLSQILRDHDDTPIIPGSTWKGVLRARVEFILRSTGIGDVCASVEDNTSGSCGTCVVCGTFGWSERPGRTPDNAEPPKTAGARGRLLFTDSPVHGGEVRVRNHVAIDRVFGGARDEALYAEETVEDGHVSLHIRHDKPVADLIRAALILALTDLADGTIGVGGGTTRGYGTLAAQPATADWLSTEHAWAVTTLRAHHNATRPAPGPNPDPGSATQEAPA
ncbi:RAMP superfamily CRISPR-associated protein [Streptomyces sp. NPDC006864]|uniref:RAMP superfamily CRISPR-associated protein n=1 Tax=Streptomyces sp. NPDC006864 TaxID=3154780 RepID=UPI003454EFF9